MTELFPFKSIETNEKGGPREMFYGPNKFRDATEKNKFGQRSPSVIVVCKKNLQILQKTGPWESF